MDHTPIGVVIHPQSNAIPAPSPANAQAAVRVTHTVHEETAPAQAELTPIIAILSGVDGARVISQ